jgi:uncharacterized protein
VDRELLDQLLADYRQLIAKVDAHVATVAESCADQLACRPGCASCCRHLTVTSVEAFALARALQDMPGDQAAKLREGAAAAGDSETCPLLVGGLCRLYAARPLICRTHGLPLLVEDEAGRRVDFCPQNFTAVESLPAALVLDLERLNILLALINRQFLAGLEAAGVKVAERLPLAAALALQLL